MRLHWSWWSDGRRAVIATDGAGALVRPAGREDVTARPTLSERV
jgi:hypothetical protein